MKSSYTMKKFNFNTVKEMSLVDAITKAHAKTMVVKFIKADGTMRTMLAKRNVKRFLSKNPNKRTTKSNPEVVRVFDMESKSYKSFRLDSVKEVRYGCVIWSDGE